MPTKDYQPRTEPPWDAFAAEVDAGVIRLTEQQMEYLRGRLAGRSHKEVAEDMGLKTFPGFRLRGRLIDGWEKLTEIRHNQQAAS